MNEGTMAALLGAVAAMASAIAFGARWLMAQLEKHEERAERQQGDFLAELGEQRSALSGALTAFSGALMASQAACQTELRELTATYRAERAEDRQLQREALARGERDDQDAEG